MASGLRSRLTSLLSTAQKTVQPAATYVGKEVSTRYDKLLKDNAQYVVKDKAAADKLLRQWFFTRLSGIPAIAEECQHEWGALKGKWAARRELAVEEAGTYLLFVGELGAWFVVGEIVGRGFTFSGYSI
eukprot:jgi/Botrbrau1/14987/Bobra.0018s0087.1